ncbi:MAG TPA: hypothetical protein VM513_01710 [Kofleriaceae bacterium]|nr:hypothetical protein [Kofleriaceae bacterium]
MRGAGIAAGLVLGGAIASIVSCARPGNGPWLEKKIAKHNEIAALWTQIRGWRRDAAMGLDPAPQAMSYVQGKSVREGIKACPVAKPRACDDVCSLGDAICDNAEAICGIADELGKDDDFAQQKCASAKASCIESQQRCCECSTKALEAAP